MGGDNRYMYREESISGRTYMYDISPINGPPTSRSERGKGAFAGKLRIGARDVADSEAEATLHADRRRGEGKDVWMWSA